MRGISMSRRMTLAEKLFILSHGDDGVGSHGDRPRNPRFSERTVIRNLAHDARIIHHEASIVTEPPEAGTEMVSAISVLLGAQVVPVMNARVECCVWASSSAFNRERPLAALGCTARRFGP